MRIADQHPRIFMPCNGVVLPTPFGLFAGYFQPLTPPQPLNPLVIDLPTGLS